MLDAGFFKKHFPRHAAQTGPKVRAEVHLTRGAVYEIEAVREIEEGYVVLRVYPTESREFAIQQQDARLMELDEAPAALDRVVIPYESIACIHLFPVNEDSRRSVGFRTTAASRER